ncbi:prepilin-type N-terminal cleavage/methylation domain-containing protein [Geomonas sp. RF6]|uniref:pilus assembly FimT family protein n=1 Tax=Geomonas sp. RF6 TaxID=2897342 RepID=UPI001E4715DA|nr:prepilin-type N-terminal cleavage/methylation domain-containing protein [Geomonas sp. RF6]UFS69643.1 prepilin-type N-terminal cleavage/methylation domain-containing protein [Geomonas sp. RF6]
MRERGFSLIELVVVLCIVSILLGIAVLRFSDYIRRSRKEAQTRMIQTEIMQARLAALTERRGRRVKLKRTSFEVYSSTQDDEDGASPRVRLQLNYPITWNCTGTAIDIDDRGIISPPFRSICMEESGDRNLTDSVVLYYTRVNLGSRKEGKDCASEFITVK